MQLNGPWTGLSLATLLISSKEALSRIKQVVEYLDANDGLCQGDEVRRTALL